MDGHVKLTCTPSHMNYKKFRDEDKFTDITLLSDSTSLKCHRIVLARQSVYFHQILPDHKDPTFTVPKNPGNVLPTVIDFLYGSDIVVTSENFAPLLFCARCYAIQRLITYLHSIFKDVMNVTNVLELAKSFDDLYCGEMDEEIANMITPMFLKQDLFTRPEFYNVMSPSLFMAVLMRIPGLSTVQKLKWIDEYFAAKYHNKPFHPLDARAFAGMFDWTQKDSYKWLLETECAWLPVDISRGLYSTILDKRRKIIAKTSKLKVSDTIRWMMPFTLFTSIAQAEVQKTWDILSLLSTLGDTARGKNRLDPVKYGWVEYESGPQQEGLIGKYMGPEKVMIDGEYFCASGTKAAKPFWGIRFTVPTGFLLKRIEVVCSGTNKHRERHEFPQKVVVSGVVEGENKDREIAKVQVRDENVVVDVSLSKPCQKIVIRADDETENGAWVLRICSVKLIGLFMSDIAH